MSDELDLKYLDDEFRQMIAKHGKKFVTWNMFAEALNFAKAMNLKNVERNARLDALEQRISALEARPSIQDKGVWQCGAFYEPGDIVSRGGSAWICRGSHVAVGDDLSHEHFRLLVKRGRDAR